MATPTYDDMIATIKASSASRTSALDAAIQAATESLTTGYDTAIGKVSELRRSPTYDPVKQASSVWGGMVAPSTKDIIDSIIAAEQSQGQGWSPSARGGDIVESAFKASLPYAQTAAREARAGGESLGLQEANYGAQKGLGLADIQKMRGTGLGDIQAWETSLLTNAMKGESDRISQLRMALLPYMSAKEMTAAFPDYGTFPEATQRAAGATGGSSAKDIAASGGVSAGGSNLNQTLADIMTLSKSINTDPWSYGQGYSNTFDNAYQAQTARSQLASAASNLAQQLNTSTRKKYF